MAPEPQDLRTYLEVLQRRWRIIVAVIACTVVIALALSLSETKKYSATAEVLLNRQSAGSQFDSSSNAVADYLNASRQLSNEVRALESGTVSAAVEERYDGPLEPEDVRVTMNATTTDVVEVRLTGTDPEAVAELVNLYVEVYIDVRRQQRIDDVLAAATQIQARIDGINGQIAEVRRPLTDIDALLALDPDDSTLTEQRELVEPQVLAAATPLESQRGLYQQQLDNLQLSAGLAQSSGAQLLTPAEVPDEPVSPKPVTNTIFGIVIGLLLGLVAAFIRDALDERIRTLDDLLAVAPNLPILAMLPVIATDRAHGPSFITVRDVPESAATEDFRNLRTSIMFAGLERPVKVIQVTSAVAGEGKTTIAANLACAFAQSGERVTVVGADLRRPRIHQLFEQPRTPGLTDVLLRTSTLGDTVATGDTNLRVLCAGTASPNPSELLSSGATASVVQVLSEQSDTVIIDSTPVVPVADAAIVSRLVDAVLVIVDVRTTKRKVVRQALESLEQVGAPVLGLVLNGVKFGTSYGYGGDYTAALDRVARRRPSRIEA